MKPSTKTAAIENALRRSDGLTTAAAFELGDTDLPSTVRRLRLRGIDVTSEWRTGLSRYDRPCKWLVYKIL